MKEYPFTIRISATQENEATDKMAALVVLAAQLSAKELTKMAHVVKNDPIKTTLAKKYLGL